MELTDMAEVHGVVHKRLPNGNLDVRIHLEVPREAVDNFMVTMFEQAAEREAAQEERHLDALHEAACGA